MDKKYFNQVGKISKDAEKQRQDLESKGEENMYSQLKPWIRSELVNLLEQRVDVLSKFLATVENKQEEKERWYQILVKSLLKDSR